MAAQLPRFSRGTIVLAPDSLRYNPCDDLIFPSVIKASDHIAQPLGTYYLYYAPHDAPGGICLAYADAVTGPWTEYAENPIITRKWDPHYEVSHISSPHLLWMKDLGKYHLYFHGENDTTRIASSVDGIHFEYEGVAVHTQMYDAISEASYARVFPCEIPSEDAAYVLLFMGNNEGTRRIYAAWSQDGVTFTAQKEPLISPSPATGVTQVGAPWYLPTEGRNLIVFHGDQAPPDLRDLSTDLYVADVGPDFNREDHLGLFYRRQEISDDNRRVSDACIFHDEGQDWLFLAAGARLKQTIALAKSLPSPLSAG